MSIRIGILGYGNLGKGVELAVQKNDDMELVALFTRSIYTHHDYGRSCIRCSRYGSVC